MASPDWDAHEAARGHLREFLKRQKVDMATASKAIRRNPTYIQQYIKTGTPRWLREKDIKALARFLPALDVAPLREPIPESLPAQPASKIDKRGRVDLPRGDEFHENTQTPDLLGIWRDIPPDRRTLALRVLAQFRGAADDQALVA